MTQVKKQNSKVSLRMWITFILVGLIGQFAWAIENMYLNSYITYLNFTDVNGGGFNYSLMIALTTAFSAIVATLTTIFMGSLTDKVNKRKIFISIGYIVWGLSTASFGLLNVNSSSSLFALSMTAQSAAIMVIVIDCIMTFFGSTSNDAAFSSYVTKNTTNQNRGKVEGVLSILPLIAMLIIFVGLNGLTTEASGYRWDLFFYIVGGLVLVVGLISVFLIPKEKEEKSDNEGYIRILTNGFKVQTIKDNKLLYLVLIAYFIYGVAIQVYFPYLMVYVEYTCNISNTGEGGFLTPFAIVMAIALLIGSLLSVIIGFISDKVKKEKMMIPVIIILILGLFLMFFAPLIQNEILRIIYTSFSGLIMILGYVSVPTILNSMVKDNIPKGKEGSFMGVRMLFVVALPMCIGPFIGDALNASLGKTYESNFGVSSYVPSEYGYLVAILILLLSFIPIYFIFKEIKKKKIKNQGYLYNDLKEIKEEELEFNLDSHPRPQLRRDNFLLLNGEWDIKISKDINLPSEYLYKVIVPYAIESPLSKVNHLLEVDEYIYYHKIIKIPDNLINDHIFLNFEGVDQVVDIYLNNKFILTHIGGYTRFKVDLKEYLDVNNKVEITLRVKDVSDDSYYMAGKQRLVPSGWFYSSSSGIYKPVYLESTPKEFIESIKYESLFDLKSIKVFVKTNVDGMVNLIIDNESYLIHSNQEEIIQLKDFKPWSIESPYLYQVKLIFMSDIVYSYFGVRKIEIKGEAKKEIYLNNKRIILNGLLDQGYYYLGGLTPKSYEDYYLDIKNIKDLGFNTLRKHIKVECDLYYYFADKLGIFIIQDIPCGGDRIKFLDVVIPRISYKYLNNEKFLSYKKYGRLNEVGRNEFINGMNEIIENTTSFPSVIIYTIFNEAWGEFDPTKIYLNLKPNLKNQLIDTASGWLDTENSDFFSIHSYTLPLLKRKDPLKKNRPYILTEVGGASLKIKNHYDYPSLYGHGKCKSKKALEKKYIRLYQGLIKRIKDNNLNGIIYTELNDCETEANGLYTLDRKVLKIDKDIIIKLNKEIEDSIK